VRSRRQHSHTSMRSGLVVLLCQTLATAALQPPLGLVRESALPLAGKRVLILSPRARAAPLVDALVRSAARPIWCPAVRLEPLKDFGELDDALMRLASEHYVLILPEAHTIDVLAERMLSIADGSDELVAAMLEASSVEIGAIGDDGALVKRRLGVPVTVMPIEPTELALVSTLADLGYVHPGARVLLAAARGEVPLAHPPGSVGVLLEALKAQGSKVSYVPTHTLAAVDVTDLDTELGLLRAGKIDAVCVSSSEEVALLGREWPGTNGPLPLVLALGELAQEAAAEALDGADILGLGARVQVRDVVDALEGHFGAGRLLF
jgi:uroporphyrinogen-III synthase